jgi:hypothetical protein
LLGSFSRNTPIRTAIVFIIATIAAYLAIVFGWIAYADYAHVADNEGAKGMGVVFVYGPVCAILIGAGAALLFGGARASLHVKAAAGIIGLLILAWAVLLLIGL